MDVPAEHEPVYLFKMMERLGIEPGGGVVARRSLTYATALHRCNACPSKQPCREWLDTMPQSVGFAPRFCPNADILFELQVDQPNCSQPRSLCAAKAGADRHAHKADLALLEDEIDEILIRKAADDSLIADLKARRSHLKGEMERLQREAAAQHPSH